MSPPRKGAHTPTDRLRALKDAENWLIRPRADEPKTVELRISEIETMPEVFQPREFDMGLRETSKRHVGRLQRRIGNVGELDPVVVIKLKKFSKDFNKELPKGRWVIVEGHHRHEAYRKSKHQQPITCEWFDGTVREAWDESLRRNIALNLEVPLADRQEAAWVRVLDGKLSKSQLVKTCGVAAGTISHMRRVKERYEDKSRRAKADKQFRRDVAAVGGLGDCSWWTANLINRNATPGERTLEQKINSLAKNLRSRYSNGKLAENPEVTAGALAVYDADLPQLLTLAWAKADKTREMKKTSEVALQRLLEASLQETEKIKTEIARRQTGEVAENEDIDDAAGEDDEDDAL